MGQKDALASVPLVLLHITRVHSLQLLIGLVLLNPQIPPRLTTLGSTIVQIDAKEVDSIK